MKEKKLPAPYAVSSDYDEWQYIVNEKERKELPKGTKAITVEVGQR